MKVLLAILLTFLLSTVTLAQETKISVDHSGFEALKAKHSDLLILDVRSPREYQSGYIPGAENIEFSDINTIRKRLKKGQPVILYCRSGRRAGIVAEQLLESGYTDVYHLKGDMLEWLAAEKPIVTDP
ncbi:MAG: rhodanese-like domain-containing protein [Gammaproteobacteria bacterium]|nr:rhodanese-like domain-containing protein [Gammaproteobacteria bacterium]NNJ72620.1 rhodanese-like domain-containing protein [Enterobacterales bacterium]